MRDCNTCRFHVQGAHPAEVYLNATWKCSDCLSFGLCSWQPKTEDHKVRQVMSADLKQPGAKDDGGKAPISRGVLEYFPRAIEAVALLSLYGSEKYSWAGWEKVPDGVNRYRDAGDRHKVARAKEGPYDREWESRGKQVLHSTAVAWNALAALELELRAVESPSSEKG